MFHVNSWASGEAGQALADPELSFFFSHSPLSFSPSPLSSLHLALSFSLRKGLLCGTSRQHIWRGQSAALTSRARNVIWEWRDPHRAHRQLRSLLASFDPFRIWVGHFRV